MSKPIRILFLCVANSARSQMAEGLAKSIFGRVAIVESAGSVPSGRVQPMAVEVLREVEIDISKNWSKSVDQLPADFLARLDYVITLCADEICPTLPSKAKRLHWPISDPALPGTAQQLAHYQTARDAIRTKIVEFAHQLASKK